VARPRAAHIRPVARGGYYNKGEGIRTALAADAAPARRYQAIVLARDAGLGRMARGALVR
jgi:hypothetical protein